MSSDIHAIEVEDIPFAANQFHDAKTNGVGAVGRPRGKNAPFHVLEKRLHSEFCRFRPIEMVDQINMREAFKVSQAFFIFGKYFRPPATALRINRVDGCLLSYDVLAIDNTRFCM